MKIEELIPTDADYQTYSHHNHTVRDYHTVGARATLAKIQRLAEKKPILFVPKGWDFDAFLRSAYADYEVIENE